MSVGKSSNLSKSTAMSKSSSISKSTSSTHFANTASTNNSKSYSKAGSNTSLNNALGGVSKAEYIFPSTRINNTPIINVNGQPKKLPPLQRAHNPN